MNIDLDAARAEAEREPTTVTFKGETFEVSPGLRFLLALQENDLKGAVELLFNGSSDRFLELDPDVRDIESLVRGLVGTTGLTLGESSASGASSPPTSKRSRRPGKPAITRT